MGRTDAAAIAAHYGSISIVTFATMAALLKANQIAYDGWMVAVAAAMEAPAIAMALILARAPLPETRADTPTGTAAALAAGGGQIAASVPGIAGRLRGAFSETAVPLLLGALVLGWIAGEMGAEWQGGFVERFFPAALCFFLLGQGLGVGRGLPGLARTMTPRLLGFAVGMPLAGGALGLMAALAVGLSPGSAALMAALAASASYIVAPAAVRTALPEARADLAVTLALCVTLPFNLLVGLPLYLAAAQWLAG
jgi:hypothetical protein